MQTHNRIALGTLIALVAVGLFAPSVRAALTSPYEACLFYKTRWEQGLMKVIDDSTNASDPRCLVQVGDSNSGIGYIEAKYEGGQFCLKSYGAYFNNSGIKDSTECIPVSRTSGTSGARPGVNPFADLLKDPNLKWYTVAAIVIAGLSYLSGRLISRRKRSQTQTNKKTP